MEPNKICECESGCMLLKRFILLMISEPRPAIMGGFDISSEALSTTNKRILYALNDIDLIDKAELILIDKINGDNSSIQEILWNLAGTREILVEYFMKEMNIALGQINNTLAAHIGTGESVSAILIAQRVIEYSRWSEIYGALQRATAGFELWKYGYFSESNSVEMGVCSQLSNYYANHYAYERRFSEILIRASLGEILETKSLRGIRHKLIVANIAAYEALETSIKAPQRPAYQYYDHASNTRHLADAGYGRMHYLA